MPRLATTSDVFNAVAEPQRRRIISLLSRGDRPVNDIARKLRVRQPQASKHLNVLRQVGLVDVRRQGRQRFYHLRPQRLKPIHDWVSRYERFWTESFDRLDVYLKQLQANNPTGGPGQGPM
ncbi:MAG: winged helix-turn-helix transcriptional regulator [Phycisphaeraceae bacterium]|nr:winged helix-turn-helix transcriptional regulator [Phycisphaeraceae bacterium]